MTLTEQLREEKRKLFGITYVPKKEKAIGEVPDIMKKYIVDLWYRYCDILIPRDGFVVQMLSVVCSHTNWIPVFVCK